MTKMRKPGFWISLWVRLSASAWTPIVLGIVVLGLLVLVQMHRETRPFARSATSGSPTKAIRRTDAEHDSASAAARRVLTAYRIRYGIQRNPKTHQEIWTAKVPPEIPLPSVHLAVQEAMAGTGAAVIRASSDPSTGKTVIQIGKKDTCYFLIQLASSRDPYPAAGKIALVIDDFGDRLDTLALAFFSLDGRITVSVLPGRRLSTKVAQEANNRGCEVILHLSMEPMQAAFQEDGYTILTKMPRAEIQSAFQKALDQVPCAVGVNNHMGSRATSDRQTMLDVLEGVKQKGLYFMDSYTVASSVAYTVARELGIPSAKRDVFVDVDGNGDAIRLKLRELAQRARKNGIAIGIGHCHRNMLTVLREEIPRIQREGLRFVPLSEVVQ